MKKRLIAIILCAFCVISACMLASCGDNVDTSTDTETDTETVDSSTDTETDTEADSSTDTESNIETDTESDTETDTSTGTSTKTETETEAQTDTDTETEIIDSSIETDIETEKNSESDTSTENEADIISKGEAILIATIHYYYFYSPDSPSMPSHIKTPECIHPKIEEENPNYWYITMHEICNGHEGFSCVIKGGGPIYVIDKNSGEIVDIIAQE
ncbi:MAG: hypothetical protein E7602_07450 [Ruminococcaceae bacterium]|nr:hypothetical protein [Oscillospiraceae bacterium]